MTKLKVITCVVVLSDTGHVFDEKCHYRVCECNVFVENEPIIHCCIGIKAKLLAVVLEINDHLVKFV